MRAAQRACGRVDAYSPGMGGEVQRVVGAQLSEAAPVGSVPQRLQLAELLAHPLGLPMQPRPLVMTTSPYYF